MLHAKQGVGVRLQLTACKIDDIEAFAKKMLAKGHCIVIGLQSTGTHFFNPAKNEKACMVAPLLRPIGCLALQMICRRACSVLSLPRPSLYIDQSRLVFAFCLHTRYFHV